MTDDAVPADCAAEETPEENLLKSSAAVTLRALSLLWSAAHSVAWSVTSSLQ